MTGIKASGKHGANPGEQDSPQEFVVDIIVQLEVGNDELDETLDYETIIKTAKTEVEDNSYKLIETLAYNIASKINNLKRAVKTHVSVHKPSAAEKLGAEDITADAMVEKGN